MFNRYDLYDVEITPQRSRQQGGRSINAPANFYFVSLTISEMLFEGRKSIRYYLHAVVLMFIELQLQNNYYCMSPEVSCSD